MSVSVYNLKDGAMQGEKNGYSYRFVQSFGNSTVYQISDPTGQYKMVEVTSRNDVDALIKDPEAFWNLYCVE